MSPEHQQPNYENINAELAFVQQALAAADRSERSSRIIISVLAILAVVAFIWMHLHMFPPETLAGLLHSLLRVDLFFLVLLFAITMYLRQVMNKNNARIRWLQQRERELLPTRYVHAVFTLPRELAPLALQNKRLIYSLLFRTSAATLLEGRHSGSDPVLSPSTKSLPVDGLHGSPPVRGVTNGDSPPA